MTTSREIKKALTAKFKGVKFSVKTRNVCCETITVEWTGYPFIEQVREITEPWNTFVNKSDIYTDYFSYSGTEINFSRNLTDDEASFLSTGILKAAGYSKVDGIPIIWDNNSSYFKMESGYNWGATREVNHLVDDWLKNGLSISLDESPQAQDAAYEARKQQEEFARLEFQSKMSPLIQGDYTGTPANDNLNYVMIHWHEGVQAIENDAKFSSFKAANDAIRKIYDQHGMEWSNDIGYNKLKFSIHFTDGEVYEGRLDLSPREDDPFSTDNIFAKHCVEFLEWQIKNNNCQDSKAYLKKYSFEDIAPKPSNIIQFPQKPSSPSFIIVDESLEFLPITSFLSDPIVVDEPKIDYTIVTNYEPSTPVNCQARMQLYTVVNEYALPKPTIW